MNRTQKIKTKREIAEYLLTEIENYTRAGISPVDGGEFADLSTKYKKKKQAMGKGGQADLHLTNAMINAIQARFKENGVELAITNSKEKKKAYNHNVGDTLPERPFLPDDSARGAKKKFAPAIERAIKEIIDANKD